jgi:hypothetical protein
MGKNGSSKKSENNSYQAHIIHYLHGVKKYLKRMESFARSVFLQSAIASRKWQRISDRRILKLIRKWLKAGFVKDDQFYETHLGSPRGA